MTRSGPTPPLPRRPAKAAGLLYPDDPVALGTVVRAALDAGAPPGLRERPAISVLAPHGGLRLSGPVAGATFARVRVPDVAIVVSPRHASPTGRPSILTHGALGLPGGDVPIAEHVAEALRDAAGVQEDERAHRDEHGVELQLPFLRARAPQASVVPLLVGDSPSHTLERIAAGIADVVTQFGRDVLLVGSVDLGRGREIDEVRRSDDDLVAALEALDRAAVRSQVAERPMATCAGGVLDVIVGATLALGGRTGTCVARSTTADRDPGARRIVGYAGLVFR